MHIILVENMSVILENIINQWANEDDKSCVNSEYEKFMKLLYHLKNGGSAELRYLYQI